MKYAVLSLLSVVTFSNSVTASPQLKMAISDLATQIKVDTFDTQADDGQLKEALQLLQAASEIIKSQNNSQPCVEWAYPLYYQSLSSDAAQTHAVAACKSSVDLETAKWLYVKFYQGLSSADSVDRATLGARRAKGKLPIIQYAFDNYYKGNSSSESATKAAEGAKLVLPTAKACLEKAYAIQYKTHSSSDSMDLAFRDCKN